MEHIFGDFALRQGLVVFVPINEGTGQLTLTEDEINHLIEQGPPGVVKLSLVDNTYEYGEERVIKFNYTNPITVFSNRYYDVEIMVFDGGFFKKHTTEGGLVKNVAKISISGEDVDIISAVDFFYPQLSLPINSPFIDHREYQYSKDGLLYYGSTGLPVNEIKPFNEGPSMVFFEIDPNDSENVTTGTGKWRKLKTRFKLKDGVGRKEIQLSLKIETNYGFNLDKPLYLDKILYRGADVLVQDERKEELLIEKNFDNNFIGGIQKLRIYDNALNSQEVIHNASKESLSVNVNKGGRIIYT
jgi:hypothetical protein